MKSPGCTAAFAETDHYDWGCEYYLKHGRMMAEDGLDIRGDTMPSFWGQ